MRRAFTITASAVLATALAAAGCRANGGPADPQSEPVPDVTWGVALDDTLQVPLGAERTADGGRVAVRFVAKVNDSRCPANAMCVWAGDASVRLVVRSGAATRDTVLHTNLEPRAVVVGAYTVSVPSLLPYPGTYPDGSPPHAPIVLVRVARP